MCFAVEFLQEFDRLRGEQGVSTLYKFRLPTPTGESRIANITIAPLLNRDFQAVGRIVIVDDITDRINMETQLTQAEKLSSIGLAGGGRGARGEYAAGGDLELCADAGQAVAVG